MSKSLNARCIRRWKVRFKPICDSKVNHFWRKYHLRGFVRGAALTTAGCMIDHLAYNNAMHNFFAENGDDDGWSPEFAEWYRSRRTSYLKEALDYLNEEATNDEIDEEIDNELEAWND